MDLQDRTWWDVFWGKRSSEDFRIISINNEGDTRHPLFGVHAQDKLKYKNFIGIVHYSAEDVLFYGKIQVINDLVTFEGSSVDKLKKNTIS